MPRSPGPTESARTLAKLRDGIVAAGRRLGVRGLIAAGEGNLSVRIAGDRLLITPSGRRKDELSAGDLLEVSARTGGRAAPSADARPSSDLAIHRAIYAARPDVRAVVHAHPPAAMALTLAGETPDPTVLPETAMFLARLPFVPFAPPGSEPLAKAIAEALSKPPPPLPGAALLERHGAIAVGEGAGDATAAIDQAVDRLELVDVLCRTWRDALLIRAATTGARGRAILRPPSPRSRAPARGRGRRHS